VGEIGYKGESRESGNQGGNTPAVSPPDEKRDPSKEDDKYYKGESGERRVGCKLGDSRSVLYNVVRCKQMVSSEDNLSL
jgi:hypothetical protein